MRLSLRSASLAALAISTAGCIVFHRVQVQQVVPQDSVVITSPVKAHLKDGATVVYSKGVSISGGILRGVGTRYDLAVKWTKSTNVDSIPLDSVVGMESFQTTVDQGKTAVVSTLVTAASVLGGLALFKAIFGSCPTVYSENGTVDEAELFSNSIAPLFEARDVDRLRAQPDRHGIVRLELRNEAMETHYINHIQLFEVRHSEDEFVLPDSQGQPVAVRGVRTPKDIRSRNGQELISTVGAPDNVAYKTDGSVIDGATQNDLNDWIDFTAPVADGAGSTTLVFRVRNSLLSTTLLYEVMLAPAGAHAIDWLGSGLAKISTAVELGRWHQRMAGMHISVWRDGAYQEVTRIPDSGPISWHDVAAVIPAQKGEKSLRIRLSFLADHWRFDHVGVATAEREPVARVVPLSTVIGSNGIAEEEARRNMVASDDRYLQTNPGNRFFAEFNVGANGVGESRTFLLSSQGYYIEWIRGEWIKTSATKESFKPSDQAIVVALRKWSASREIFEARFRKDRVPVH